MRDVLTALAVVAVAWFVVPVMGLFGMLVWKRRKDTE